MYFSNEINNHLENKKPHDTKANTCHNWSWYGNLIWYRSSYRDIGFIHIVAHPKVFAITIAMVITMAVAHYTIKCLGYSGIFSDAVNPCTLTLGFFTDMI
jgi:hypothetical protein